MMNWISKLLLTALLLSAVTLPAQVQIGMDIDGEAPGDQSGEGLAISQDGTLVAIGAPINSAQGQWSGHVRIFKLIDGDWLQLGTDIDGQAEGDWCGRDLAISDDGTRIAISSFQYNGGIGQVRIFELQPSGIWIQLGEDIDGLEADEMSGFSVDLSGDGNVVVLSAVENSSAADGAGQVRVFRWENEKWNTMGNILSGDDTNTNLGWSVSISNNGYYIAMSSLHINNGAGRVQVYTIENEAWVQVGQDIIGEGGDLSGWSMDFSSDGSRIIIGGLRNSGNGPNCGVARIFELNEDRRWYQIGQDLYGRDAEDRMGYDVSMSHDGNRIGILATQGGIGNEYAGYAQVFDLDGTRWSPVGTTIEAEAEFDAAHNIALSGDGLTVAIGASANDGNGSNSGHVRVYDLNILSPTIEPHASTEIKLFPNPTTNILRITTTIALNEVRIYTNTGHLIASMNLDKGFIDVSDLPGGLYILHGFSLETEEVWHDSFIKL